jgi:hypothetical protein
LKLNKKIVTTASALMIAGLALTGCGQSDLSKRQEAQKTSQIKNSLEKQNLEKKRAKEEDPSAIRYLYVMNFGKIVGYYVTQGKVSSNGSQIGPETEVVWSNGSGWTLDSAKDDGTYGTGDPGIFFFTTDGVMVETSLDYIQSDAPIAIDVPRLGGTEKK